jgi:large subunit ribosomal protein L13
VLRPDQAVERGFSINCMIVIVRELEPDLPNWCPAKQPAQSRRSYLLADRSIRFKTPGGRLARLPFGPLLECRPTGRLARQTPGNPVVFPVERLPPSVRFCWQETPVAGTKTYVAKPNELAKTWWLVDADNQIVGKLASRIAVILMGKHRPEYTPHLDTGDFVVVVNCDKIQFTGDKWNWKTYNWFTGYTGLRLETAQHRLERAPELILREAVRRMLPKSNLGKRMLNKLKLYAGSEHPHQAQNPQPLVIDATA